MIKNVFLFVLMLGFLLAACDKGTLTPAALGDRAALEQLADAYRRVGQQYPMQPQAMPPKGKREFVQRVFVVAGYDYTATLIATAKAGVNAVSQDQQDLVELLFLPHKGLAEDEFAGLYSEQELAAVRVIQAGLR